MFIDKNHQLLMSENLENCQHTYVGFSYKKQKIFSSVCKNEASIAIETNFSNNDPTATTYKTKGRYRSINLCNDCLTKILKHNIQISSIKILSKEKNLCLF